ncbi:MAG: hypothetical protein BHW58_04320 [Azospirillum sp. 51_20]|jgi:hypothetical protein|nr:MAG: hypothetical protein BHW58_04320 [Azospirillum sp. 51_20]
MQNLTTLKTVLFAALLTVPALSASAQCPGGGACPQAVEDCACPAQMGSGEDCACPQVKTIETRQPGGCIQAASKNGDCGEAKPVAYTLAPRSDEFKMSARQQLFSESAEEKEDRDGSIFGGGPCVSCDKNGSIFGGGPCKTCDKNGSIFGGAPCNGPACRPEKTNPKYIQNYILYDDSLYSAIHRQCGDFAPLELEWVDFRLKNGMDNNGYSRKLGKYRFRIFGCRRDTKNAILNEGRILEKDMSFIEIFDDMVSDCYKVVKTPNDLCLRADSPLPEYVLTAEITDYYMNLCDEYNWDEAKKEDKRIGSSEMTVVWRLMDLTKTNVLWKGKSVGYGEVEDGEYNGEIVLIERAFADAVDNLRNLPGFEDQLSKRLSPEELQRQRNALIDMQRQMDPVKCQFSEEIKVMEDSGSVSSGYGMNEGWINVPEAKMVDGQVVENSGSASSGFGAAESGNVTELQMVDGQIVENSGSVSSGSGAAEGSNVTELQLIDGQIVETSGASASGYGMAEGGNVTEIITTGGVVTEDSGVVSDGAAMYEVEAVEPLPSDMSAMIESDSLCIREQPDYDNMGPENVYKVRTAVVSVANAKGKKGAGLLISEQFVMTSADLVDRSNNSYALETINGKKLKARAFRINPKKNTALLVLDKPTQYTPLSLNLELPAVNKDNFMTLGLLNFTEGEGEGYLETGGKVSGYRYDEDGTSQIVIDTFVQSATIGGVLIDEKGRITGMAHTSRPIKDGPDLFLPIETAMKSLGVGICGKEFPQPKPKPQKSWRQKSVAPLIENTVQKAPEAMDVKERK